jgi:hypothetical protein
MSTQYIVAVFFDGTLNVDACGPFRSRQRADEACDRINEVSAWTEDDSILATTVAQVVTLRSAADLVAEASPAEREEERA